MKPREPLDRINSNGSEREQRYALEDVMQKILLRILFSGSQLGQSTVESDSFLFLLQKTVLSVELFCPKCRQNVMKVISDVVGITSIALDASKNTVTVTGEADPFKIIKKVRKFRKHASIVSIGAVEDEKKKKEEEKKKDKKDDTKELIIYTPKTCQKCEVWYVVRDDFYHHCSIL
ncbi:hypothetical protein V6N13_011760 [Hibiscus sabdariffa]|uniref:HMA domain-containing protein n=1 Tax=Hibiscus sabdariffa TaxID=183260 RepID=A0ABR2SE04_9ROSI